jgi:hypothetical protein
VLVCADDADAGRMLTLQRDALQAGPIKERTAATFGRRLKASRPSP